MPSKKGRKSKDNLKKVKNGKAQPAAKEADSQSVDTEVEPDESEVVIEQEQAMDPFLLDATTKRLTWRRLKSDVFKPLSLRDLKFSEEVWPMLAVFAFAIMLYGITAPRHVTLEDDGLFLMLLHHFGVGHPPGYPLYSLMGFPFYNMLPDFFTPAYKGHMFSGFMAAIACVAVYAIVAMLVRSRICAFAAGLAYAASEAFWSQAIIAEVYALNAAMFFIVMALCVKFASHTGNSYKGHLALYCLIALTYGLALSNHWPLTGLGTIGLVMMVLSQWKRLFKFAPAGIAFLILGLLPYVWLIMRSHSETAVNFYGPIEDLEALWFYVTRSGYSGVDKQEGVGLPEKIEFTIFFLNQLQRQITFLGLGVAAVGFIAMLRSAAHSWLAMSLAVSWFMAGPLMIILIDFQTEFIWFSAFRVYHLLCYGITVIYFGYGLAWIGSKLYAKRKRLMEASVAVSAYSLLVVAASVITEWRQNDRSDYTFAHDLAMFKLTQVEPDTLLFTFDDLDLPVGYLNLVEGVRPDVTIFNDQGLVFGERIYSPFLPDDRKAVVIQTYAEQNSQKPVYYHPFRTKLFKSTESGSDFLGFWRRINKDGRDDRIILSDNLYFWLEESLEGVDKIVDRWTRQQAAGIIATLITAILQAQQHGYALSDDWQNLIQNAYEKSELVHLFVLWQDVFGQQIDEEKAIEELAWIDHVILNKADYVFDNSNLSDILVLKSQLYVNFPELLEEDELHEVYEKLLIEALEFEFKYSTYQLLGDFYRGEERHVEAIAILEDRFDDVSTMGLDFRSYHNLLNRELEAGKLLKPVLKLPEVDAS